MFTVDHNITTVNVVLPPVKARQVAEHLMQQAKHQPENQGRHALLWQARGSLLHEHWLKRWIPPISPAKTMMQMVVPDSQVDGIIESVVDIGKLNYQATGAVFSTRHEHTMIGREFSVWPGEETKPTRAKLHTGLTAIVCIVSHRISDRVCGAAIRAGAHGPIVYCSEGRGIRDRLGWLRITKEHEKEVLTLICDEEDVDDVFDAMAKAGGLHLPGRGFMYRTDIAKGLFNLPSRLAHHHHEASLQQIIGAIDHLQGHAHWRDQSAFDVGHGRGAGVKLSTDVGEMARTCFTAVVRRTHVPALTDLFIDEGVPGLNINFARQLSDKNISIDEGPVISDEYALLRAIVPSSHAGGLAAALEARTTEAGLHDLCLLVNPVGRVVTYDPQRSGGNRLSDRAA